MAFIEFGEPSTGIKILLNILLFKFIYENIFEHKTIFSMISIQYLTLDVRLSKITVGC